MILLHKEKKKGKGGCTIGLFFLEKKLHEKRRIYRGWVYEVKRLMCTFFCVCVYGINVVYYYYSEMNPWFLAKL